MAAEFAYSMIIYYHDPNYVHFIAILGHENHRVDHFFGLYLRHCLKLDFAIMPAEFA